MSKYAVGIYSARPAPWRPFDNAAGQANLEAAPRAISTDIFTGEGRVETYTIDYAEPQPRAVVVGRTGEGVRFVAGSTEPDIVEQMIDNDPLGATVTTAADEGGRNLVVGLAWEDVDERGDQRRAAD
jgi:acetyl-CoA C-acetyltransferase